MQKLIKMTLELLFKKSDLISKDRNKLKVFSYVEHNVGIMRRE